MITVLISTFYKTADGCSVASVIATCPTQEEAERLCKTIREQTPVKIDGVVFRDAIIL